MPVPLPLLVTDSVRFGRKVAVTVLAPSIVTAHGSVPLQAPAVQPVKVKPVPAVAVSVTRVLAL